MYKIRQKNCGSCQAFRRKNPKECRRRKRAGLQEVPPEVRDFHDCRENHHGLSSKAMEYHGAVDCCMDLLKRGLRVVVFCSDDDSCMQAHLIDKVGGSKLYDLPPGQGVVRSIADPPHRTRSFGHVMYPYSGRSLKAQKTTYKLGDGKKHEFTFGAEVEGDTRFNNDCAAKMKAYHGTTLGISKLKSLLELTAHWMQTLEHAFGDHTHCSEHFECSYDTAYAKALEAVEVAKAAALAKLGPAEAKTLLADTLPGGGPGIKLQAFLDSLPDPWVDPKTHPSIDHAVVGQRGVKRKGCLVGKALRERFQMHWEYFGHPAKLKESMHPYNAQKNEGINGKGRANCPKDRNYGKGRSFHYRWASTIGESNEGRLGYHDAVLSLVLDRRARGQGGGVHMKRQLGLMDDRYAKAKTRAGTTAAKATRKYGFAASCSQRKKEDAVADDARSYRSGQNVDNRVDQWSDSDDLEDLTSDEEDPGARPGVSASDEEEELLYSL